jgi:hypothetical protein
LQLQAKTARRGWQRLVRWPQPISDDALGYVLERYQIADWRSVLVAVNRTLKSNKAFESAKIAGRLVVALDANEQFKSQHRCCPDCCQRRLEVKDAQGQTQPVTEYYHRQVYAQLHGPDFSVILDVEPIRPGEDEAAAALRLLGWMRRLYGPRFFEVVTVDAWYATGPFLKAVQRLGWGGVSVLKQERYEIYQEATALSRGQKPRAWRWEERTVDLWEVKDLPFTDAAVGPRAGGVGRGTVGRAAAPGRPHPARGPEQSLALVGEPGVGRCGRDGDLADRPPALGRGEPRLQRTDPALSSDTLSPARGGGDPDLAADSGAGVQPV